MTARNEGGPVHPCSEIRFEKLPGGQLIPIEGYEHVGLSLRDHFAGQALMGMIASPVDVYVENDDGTNARCADCWADFAKCAYQASDAMLKARAA